MRVVSRSHAVPSKNKEGPKSRKLKGTKEKANLHTRQKHVIYIQYIYIYIYKHKYSYSLESRREREREGDKIFSPNKYPYTVYVYYLIICILTFTAYSTHAQIQETAHQVFFGNDSSTPPQMILDSLFMDVQSR